MDATWAVQLQDLGQATRFLGRVASESLAGGPEVRVKGWVPVTPFLQASSLMKINLFIHLKLVLRH